MQAVYAGVPTGYMAQPPWQPQMMCAPVPQHGHYMQHMPQHHWQQPMMAHQQVGGTIPMDHRGGYRHAVGHVPIQGQAQPAHAAVAYSNSMAAPVRPAMPGMGGVSPPTLPPLAAEGGMDDDMENEFPGKGDMHDMMGIGGLGCGLSSDAVDDGAVPEEMDDFLSILAKDAPIEK
jgi:hypothetical protein